MANNTELIDRYLRNELTENEKNQFEGLLSASDKSLESKNLDDEMELQKDIIMAIQARGLRECLQKKETELRAKRAQKQRLIRLSSWSFGSALVAAMAILALITIPMAQIMKQESLQYASSIDSSAVRGGAVRGGVQAQTDPLQSQLLNIYSLITQKQFDQANKNVKQLIHDLQTTQDIHSEEHKEIFDQAQWLCAICEMHQGKVFKAKKLLRQIANSDSHYAERAQMLLDELKCPWREN